MASTGYILNKVRMSIDTGSLGRLIVTVGTPALIFSTLTSPDLPPISVTATVLAALLMVCIAAVLGTVFLLLLRQPIRSFLPSLSLPNSGNVGLPVVLLAFGQEGLAIGVSVFFMIAILQYTLVPACMDDEINLKRIASEPLIYALIAVCLFRGFDIDPHPVLLQTTSILGGMVIPVMVILLGYSLADLEVSDIRLSVILAIARLSIGVLTGYLIILSLGLSGVQAGAMFLMASMPCAIVIYIFALRYNCAPRRIAGMTVASTFLTFVSLPALLWVAFGIRDGSDPILRFFAL